MRTLCRIFIHRECRFIIPADHWTLWSSLAWVWVSVSWCTLHWPLNYRDLTGFLESPKPRKSSSAVNGWDNLACRGKEPPDFIFWNLNSVSSRRRRGVSSTDLLFCYNKNIQWTLREADEADYARWCSARPRQRNFTRDQCRWLIGVQAFRSDSYTLNYISKAKLWSYHFALSPLYLVYNGIQVVRNKAAGGEHL